jgi:hypothetical protein
MRHANIATTMVYYVDLDADEMAEDLWADCPAGNTNGNNRPIETPTVVRAGGATSNG